ncbi:MAG: hypothetical protein R3B96_20570 [Pirellulaceae bacterium]
MSRPPSRLPRGDVYALGMTAMALVFGTSKASKVQASSRIDQIILKMVESDPAKRPNVAAIGKAVEDWLASKGAVDPGAGTQQTEETGPALEVNAAALNREGERPTETGSGEGTLNDFESAAVDSSGSVDIPDFMKDLAGPKVAAIPKIEAEQRFGGDAVIPATKVKLHKAEIPKHNVGLTIAIYSVIGIVTLAVSVVAIWFAVTRSTETPQEVAQAETPNNTANNEAADDAGGNQDNGPAPDGVANQNPKPLIDIDDPTEQPEVNRPPVADPFGPGGNAGGPGGNAGGPGNPVVGQEGDNTAGPNDGDMGNDTDPPTEPPVVVVDPPVVEPMPMNPTPEPMPYVPAFQDLAKAVDLPVVGQENWQNETVLGTIHLQPRDLLVVELKGVDRAFRDTTSFAAMGADGGTAVNAYDLYAITGANRDKIARLWVDGDQLKFKFYDDAEDVPAANYLRNCYVQMRTGTDVGGVALRTPVALAALNLDDRRLNATAESRLEFLPDVSGMEFRVLPLAENFPEYGFRDATSNGALKNGKVDIIFGGKYSEAMYLQVASRYTNRLTLSVEAFLLQGTRSVPYRSDNLERDLQEAANGKQLRAAQIASATPEQRAQNQNLLAALELERQAFEQLEKQTAAQLEFIDSMKGQNLPVAIYFQADEYRIYLGTPDGKPLD